MEAVKRNDGGRHAVRSTFQLEGKVLMGYKGDTKIEGMFALARLATVGLWAFTRASNTLVSLAF